MFIKSATFVATLLVLQGCVQAGIFDLKAEIDEFAGRNTKTITGIIDLITGNVKDTLDQTTNIVTDVIGNGIDTIANITGTAKDIIGNVNDKIVQVVDDIAESVSDNINNALEIVDHVSDKINTVIENASDKIDSFVENVADKIDTAKNNIKEGVAKCINAQVSAILDLPTSILTSTIKCVKDAIKSIIEDLIKTITKMNGLKNVYENGYKALNECKLLDITCAPRTLAKFVAEWTTTRAVMVAQIGKLVASSALTAGKLAVCVVGKTIIKSKVDTIVNLAQGCL